MFDNILASKQHINFHQEIPMIDEIPYFLFCLSSLSNEFGIKPTIQANEQEHALWVFYENSCILCDSFLDEYAIAFARIHAIYPIKLYGTVDEIETAQIELSLNEDNKSITCIKKDASGNDFEQMSNLCIRIHTNDHTTFALLHELCTSIDLKRNFLVVPRYPLSQSLFQNRKELDQNTYYQYIPLHEHYGKYDFLQALSMDQKINLWCLFLNDGMSAFEFEYIHQAMKHDTYYLFPWELALHFALVKCGITITYEGNFQILDAHQQPLHFDFHSTSAAEKLCMKILFPVKKNYGAKNAVIG